MSLRNGGGELYLRPLEEGDLEYLYRWENDPEVWQYGDCGADEAIDTSATTLRFSREQLRQFIENQQHGFHANEQIRLVICRREGASTPPGTPIGFVDLFDYDSAARTATIGILICEPTDRRRGYGRRALALALDHARYALDLREITCTITHGNPSSEALFARAGFSAEQKTWRYSLTL